MYGGVDGTWWLGWAKIVSQSGHLSLTTAGLLVVLLKVVSFAKCFIVFGAEQHLKCWAGRVSFCFGDGNSSAVIVSAVLYSSAITDPNTLLVLL